jgi:membrane protease subunit (stomatin/prohibitin family)
VETELSAAQAQTTVEQIRTKVQSIDMTKDIDLTTEAAALCPHCGARTQGGKFCPECGKAVHPKATCSRCGTQAEPGTKFCPECGNKLV